VVGAAGRNVGLVYGVVVLSGDGDGDQARLRLVHIVLLIPVAPAAAVGAPAMCCLGWEVIPPFAAFCASCGCWSVCGADRLKLCRVCAAFL